MSHYSLKSCKGTSDLFAVMFPDSAIAKRFTCAATKCAYLVCFGLAPYFKDILIDTVRKADRYTISIDECLNKVSQSGQMDLVVRFWNSEAGQVNVRYLGSQFHGHASAVDLLAKVKEGLKHLNSNRMSIDGPSVNWKFLT